MANLCGGHTIIETGDTLREAQQAASVRERDLRSSHALDMLPCWRVLTVDPRARSGEPRQRPDDMRAD